MVVRFYKFQNVIMKNLQIFFFLLYKALYHKSDQQRQFCKTFGDVLIVNVHYDSCNLRKTLLSISIIKDGVGCAICLITLPGRIILNVVNHCFEIFAKVSFFPVPKTLKEFVSYWSIFFLQYNDTSRASTVKVCRKELMPVVRKIFPVANCSLTADETMKRVLTKKKLIYC